MTASSWRAPAEAMLAGMSQQGQSGFDDLNVAQRDQGQNQAHRWFRFSQQDSSAW
jgi:hypothetical protein